MIRICLNAQPAIFFQIPSGIPPGVGGGGVGWKVTHNGQGLEVDVAPGGGGGGYWVESGGGGPATGAKQVGPPPIAGGAHEGGRAIGIAGAFVGALLGASALVWALYKCKVQSNTPLLSGFDFEVFNEALMAVYIKR